MAKIKGKSVTGKYREVVFEPESGMPGWTRMTILLYGKKTNTYIVLVETTDLRKVIGGS